MVYGTMQKKTTLYLPEELQRRLKDAANRRREPQAQLVREALEEYLSKQRPRRPRSLGAVDDLGIEAEDAKQWVRDQWAKKWKVD